MATATDGSAVLLYDGVCGVCNGAVQFILKRDRNERFRFAPLQGGFARDVLEHHGIEPTDLDTMYVILDPGSASERLLARSDAVLEVFRQLGGIWRLIALARFLPSGALDVVYNLVARNRYRLAGRYDSCPLPSPEQRQRFIAG